MTKTANTDKYFSTDCVLIDSLYAPSVPTVCTVICEYLQNVTTLTTTRRTTTSTTTTLKLIDRDAHGKMFKYAAHTALTKALLSRSSSCKFASNSRVLSSRNEPFWFGFGSLFCQCLRKYMRSKIVSSFCPPYPQANPSHHTGIVNSSPATSSCDPVLFYGMG